MVCAEPGCWQIRPCTVHKDTKATAVPTYRQSTRPTVPARSPSSTRTSSYHFQRFTRPFILHRDHGICHICGRAGADQVDHLIPVSKGGTDDPNNLAAAHALCNNRRGAR